MNKVRMLLVAGAIAFLSPAWPAEPDGHLSEAFASYIDSLQTAEQQLRSTACFDTKQGRARAYLHLVRMTRVSLLQTVLQDANFPYFQVIDFWDRVGGDNPDQRYLRAPVHGGAHYRVWEMSARQTGSRYSFLPELLRPARAEASAI